MWTKKGTVERSSAFLPKLADFVIAKRVPLFWVMLPIAGLLIFFATKNIQNEQFVQYFAKDIQFREDTDFMVDNLTGIYNIEYSVDGGEEGGISNPKYLRTLNEFEDWWKAKPKVKHVNTYGEVARKVNKSMHGDDPSYYKMPESRDEAAQYLLLYEMSLPFGLDLNNQVNVDKSETRFTVTVDGLSALELIEYSDAGKTWLDEHGIKGESNIGISTAIMFAHLTQRQIKSMTQGGIWAIILITLVLIIALRSFKYGVLSIVPNVDSCGNCIWNLVFHKRIYYQWIGYCIQHDHWNCRR